MLAPDALEASTRSATCSLFNVFELQFLPSATELTAGRASKPEPRHATTSIRLPGSWHAKALQQAARFLRARRLVRDGPAAGPRVFHKQFWTPVGHSHPMEREMAAAACDASEHGDAIDASDITAAAVPLIGHRLSCTSALHPQQVRVIKKTRQPVYGSG